jgi:hypothetical protein
MHMSFPETVSDSFCRSSSVVQSLGFISCLGGWSQTIPQVKKLDPGLAWLHVVCGYTWSVVTRGLWLHVVCGYTWSVVTRGLWLHVVCGYTWSVVTRGLWLHVVCGYTWSVVVRPVGRTAKYSKTTLDAAYGREMNIKFSGHSSCGHSCSQHANFTLPQNFWDICSIVLCDCIF